MLIEFIIAESPWDLAAIRVYHSRGLKRKYCRSFSKHLFNDDEIFLDAYSTNQYIPQIDNFRRTFEYWLPSIWIGNGGPLAAVPNRAIEWS